MNSKDVNYFNTHQIANIFLKESQYDLSVIAWMSIVDRNGKIIHSLSSNLTDDLESKIKRISLQQAQTSVLLMELSGYEEINGDLRLLTYKSDLNSRKHLTIAKGGVPLFNNNLEIVGGIGVFGFATDIENIYTAMMVAQKAGFVIKDTWLAVSNATLIFA
ncbi:MAG: hypothetical protein H7196_04715 [candidate division SR1 bacterium]|nr:hypothetical protein [candidate division SR1 bacterium]